jgi:hypothetical protein
MPRENVTDSGSARTAGAMSAPSKQTRTLLSASNV